MTTVKAEISINKKINGGKVFFPPFKYVRTLFALIQLDAYNKSPLFNSIRVMEVMHIIIKNIVINFHTKRFINISVLCIFRSITKTTAFLTVEIEIYNTL